MLKNINYQISQFILYNNKKNLEILIKIICLFFFKKKEIIKFVN